jgi:tetratricopeptide (TPR) repeat protein
VAVFAALFLLLLAVPSGATQAQGGATDAWTHDALTRALAAASEIADPFHRVQALAEIAEAEVAAGDLAVARANLEQAESAASQIEGGALRSWALHDIGLAHIKADDLAAAEITAEAIHDPRLHDAVVAAVVDAKRNARDVPGALATARRIQDMVRQGQSLRSIAILQATGNDLAGALTTARSIQHAGVNALAIGDVAAAIARDGDSTEARLLAARVRDSQGRSRAFAEIAAAQAGTGDIKGALVTAEQVEDKFQRAEAVGRVAAARAELDPAQARVMFTQAIAMAAGARGGATRKCETLVEIARAQVVAGDARGAMVTVQRVFAEFRNVRRESDRVALLSRIAPLQARVGDYAGAFATAMRAEDPSLRPLLVRDIAASQAEKGDVAAAVAVARGLDDRPAAAAALFGVLRAQAQAHDLSGMRETIVVALQAVRVIGSPELRAGALGSIAAAHALEGNIDAAQAVFAEAMNTAAAMDRGQQQAAVYARIADALADRRGAVAE